MFYVETFQINLNPSLDKKLKKYFILSENKILFFD